MSVSDLQREAFRLWMSAGEKSDGEQTAQRKEAVLTLQRAIESHESARHSALMSTLRKWKGVVASEEGNLMAARFEFLQGRIVAELNDPDGVPWFDAAIVESEVWDGFRVDRLRELAENLDRASVLFAAVGDRSNAQFTADWSVWFGILANPSLPAADLAERLLEYVNARTVEGAQREEVLMNQFPLKNSVFTWNYFWLARLSQETEVSLKKTFKTAASLEPLARGASLLAAPPADFKLLLHLDHSGKQTPPESQTQLMEQMKTDLQRLQTLERDTKEYVAELVRQWRLSPVKRKDDVILAIHPETRRR